MTPARELLVRQYRGQPELLEQKVTAALNENLDS